MTDASTTQKNIIMSAETNPAQLTDQDNWSLISQASDLSGMRMSAMCLNVLHDIKDAANQYAGETTAVPSKDKKKGGRLARLFQRKSKKKEQKKKEAEEMPPVTVTQISDSKWQQTQHEQTYTEHNRSVQQANGGTEKDNKKRSGKKKKDLRFLDSLLSKSATFLRNSETDKQALAFNLNEIAEKKPDMFESDQQNMATTEKKISKKKAQTLQRMESGERKRKMSGPMKLFENSIQRIVAMVNEKFPTNDNVATNVENGLSKKQEKHQKRNQSTDEINPQVDMDTSIIEEMCGTSEWEAQLRSNSIQFSPRSRNRDRETNDSRHRGKSAEEFPTKRSGIAENKRIKRKVLSREFLIVKTTITEDTTTFINPYFGKFEELDLALESAEKISFTRNSKSPIYSTSCPKVQGIQKYDMETLFGVPQVRQIEFDQTNNNLADGQSLPDVWSSTWPGNRNSLSVLNSGLQSARNEESKLNSNEGETKETRKVSAKRLSFDIEDDEDIQDKDIDKDIEECFTNLAASRKNTKLSQEFYNETDIDSLAHDAEASSSSNIGQSTLIGEHKTTHGIDEKLSPKLFDSEMCPTIPPRCRIEEQKSNRGLCEKEYPKLFPDCEMSPIIPPRRKSEDLKAIREISVKQSPKFSTVGAMSPVMHPRRKSELPMPEPFYFRDSFKPDLPYLETDRGKEELSFLKEIREVVVPFLEPGHVVPVLPVIPGSLETTLHIDEPSFPDDPPNSNKMKIMEDLQLLAALVGSKKDTRGTEEAPLLELIHGKDELPFLDDAQKNGILSFLEDIQKCYELPPLDSTRGNDELSVSLRKKDASRFEDIIDGLSFPESYQRSDKLDREYDRLPRKGIRNREPLLIKNRRIPLQDSFNGQEEQVFTDATYKTDRIAYLETDPHCKEQFLEFMRERNKVPFSKIYHDTHRRKFSETAALRRQRSSLEDVIHRIDEWDYTFFFEPKLCIRSLSADEIDGCVNDDRDDTLLLEASHCRRRSSLEEIIRKGDIDGDRYVRSMSRTTHKLKPSVAMESISGKESDDYFWNTPFTGHLSNEIYNDESFAGRKRRRSCDEQNLIEHTVGKKTKEFNDDQCILSTMQKQDEDIEGGTIFLQSNLSVHTTARKWLPCDQVQSLPACNRSSTTNGSIVPETVISVKLIPGTDLEQAADSYSVNRDYYCNDDQSSVDSWNRIQSPTVSTSSSRWEPTGSRKTLMEAYSVVGTQSGDGEDIMFRQPQVSEERSFSQCSSRKLTVDLPYSDSGYSENEVETLSPCSLGSYLSHASTITEENQYDVFVGDNTTKFLFSLPEEMCLEACSALVPPTALTSPDYTARVNAWREGRVEYSSDSSAWIKEHKNPYRSLQTLDNQEQERACGTMETLNNNEHKHLYRSLEILEGHMHRAPYRSSETFERQSHCPSNLCKSLEDFENQDETVEVLHNAEITFSKFNEIQASELKKLRTIDTEQAQWTKVLHAGHSSTEQSKTLPGNSVVQNLCPKVSEINFVVQQSTLVLGKLDSQAQIKKMFEQEPEYLGNRMKGFNQQLSSDSLYNKQTTQYRNQQQPDDTLETSFEKRFSSDVSYNIGGVEQELDDIQQNQHLSSYDTYNIGRTEQRLLNDAQLTGLGKNIPYNVSYNEKRAEQLKECQFLSLRRPVVFSSVRDSVDSVRCTIITDGLIRQTYIKEIEDACDSQMSVVNERVVGSTWFTWSEYAEVVSFFNDRDTSIISRFRSEETVRCTTLLTRRKGDSDLACLLPFLPSTWIWNGSRLTDEKPAICDREIFHYTDLVFSRCVCIHVQVEILVTLTASGNHSPELDEDLIEETCRTGKWEAQLRHSAIECIPREENMDRRNHESRRRERSVEKFPINGSDIPQTLLEVPVSTSMHQEKTSRGGILETSLILCCNDAMDLEKGHDDVVDEKVTETVESFASDPKHDANLSGPEELTKAITTNDDECQIRQRLHLDCTTSTSNLTDSNHEERNDDVNNMNGKDVPVCLIASSIGIFAILLSASLILYLEYGSN